MGCMAAIDIAKLSVEDRLSLLDEIWESLSAAPETLPLSDAQRRELDHRLHELEREGPTGVTLDEALRRITSR